MANIVGVEGVLLFHSRSTQFLTMVAVVSGLWHLEIDAEVEERARAAEEHDCMYTSLFATDCSVAKTQP